MAYNQNIPQPGDKLSQSQADLLANFQSLQTLIDVNHVDFASGDEGKHKWVTFPTQGAIPPAGSGFLAGELGLYNAINALTTQNELYVNKTNQATVVQIPTTASILSSNSAPAQNTGGWTYLPSGMIIRFGNFTARTGLATVTLGTGASAGPTYTQILSVFAVPYSTSVVDDNFAIRVGPILSNTQFQVYISSRTNTGASTGGFQYLVIGY